MPILPQGYSARPARMEDVAHLIAPAQQMSLRYTGEVWPPLDEFIRNLQSPDFHLESDSLAVWTPGEAACAGLIKANGAPPYERLSFWGAVHPVHEHKGIGTYLIAWALHRLRGFLPLAPAGKLVIASAHTYARDESGIRVMQNQGMTIDRILYEMRIVMDAEPPVPQLPAGFSIRTMDMEHDVEPLYHAIHDSFRDSYGYVEPPFAAGMERWKRTVLDTEWFDPGMVLIAESANPESGATEIVGFSMNYPDAVDPANQGILDELGVRSHWRKRGLATWLLHKTFALHWARGAKCVLLNVDATNNAGALNLYKRAGMQETNSGVVLEIVLREGE